MSKYTTEVRFICEEANGLKESAGYKDTPRVIANALASIFDFDFPIYDESYRTVLETKIINHYYTREIGYETVSLWKFALGTRMNEIMPYYNQLYKSALLEFNPFYDVDVTTEGNKNGKFDETTSASQKVDTTRTDNLQSQTTSNTSGSNSSTRTDDLRHADSETHSDQTTSSTTQIDLYSDTPQGALTDVEAERYLTTARKTTNNGTTNTSGQSESSGSNTGTVRNSGNESAEGTSNTSNTGTQDVNKTGNESGTRNYTNVDDYLEHVYGKRGGQSYASLLTEYRKTFLNIDMMIINDLADLFMNLW